MANKEETQQIPKTDNKVTGEKAEELATEGPLTQKDEVKQAEVNTQKQQKKGR